MADILRSAALVISATAANDSTQGFLNPRISLCSPPLGPDSKYFYVGEKYAYDNYSRESPLCVIDALPLNKRG
jgi:hypothetical protein